MRLIWLFIGWFALLLGGVGAILPVVPTVPFLLVAVWAFSRSSHHLRDKILHHPTFGPPIRAWQERGVVKRPAKFWATLAMACGVGWSVFLGVPAMLIGAQVCICLAIALFLITRPEI